MYLVNLIDQNKENKAELGRSSLQWKVRKGQKQTAGGSYLTVKI